MKNDQYGVVQSLICLQRLSVEAWFCLLVPIKLSMPIFVGVKMRKFAFVSAKLVAFMHKKYL